MNIFKGMNGEDPKKGGYKPDQEVIDSKDYATDSEVEWAWENDPEWRAEKEAEGYTYEQIMKDAPRAVSDEEIERESRSTRGSMQKQKFREKYRNPEKTLTAGMYDDARNLETEMPDASPEDREVEGKRFKNYRNDQFNKGLR